MPFAGGCPDLNQVQQLAKTADGAEESIVIIRKCILAASLVAVLSLMGCAARLNQFNTFAQAGINYVSASQTVLQAAGTAAVNTDSALLIRHRADLDETKRRAIVMESDALLRQRLQVLQLISAHGKLLQAYFQALASLSDPKATDTVGTAAQGVYDAIAKISPDLKNAKMGGTTVSSFIPTATAPLVAAFKSHALDKELKARAGAIANEIALQEAAFDAIQSELKTDLQEQQNFNETDNINQYVGVPPLPSNWADERLALLSTPAAVASADSASKAAAQLRSAFTAVVEGRLDTAGFTSLMGDISNMLTIAGTIKTAIQ